jgi:hypothetical protein
MDVAPGDLPDQGIPYNDPKWCLSLNGASLALGFAGNAFLMLNFARRVRYIIALPMTIILWFLATAFVSATFPSYIMCNKLTSFDSLQLQQWA